MVLPRIPVTRPTRAHVQHGINMLFKFSGFLIFGAILALVLANVKPDTYHHLAPHEIHFLVNEILMALFFLIAAKEIREAMLPGGKLSSIRAAALPLMATIGGMVGPATIYLVGARLFSPALSEGWAVPMATDIAFSYLLARFIFGPSHPAIAFLLLLAIADDAGGLIVLAVFYPVEPLDYLMLTLIGAAIAISLVMYKVMKVKTFWWYLIIPGTISWTGFYLAGFHPALALVPLAWCMPHEQSELGGPFDDEDEEVILINGEEAEVHKTDTLNQFEHWAKNPVELILGLFGFVNAGVVVSSVGTGTALVLVALILGKSLGIMIFTKIGLVFGLKLPEGLEFRDIKVLATVAGIGFTVSLFVATVAFLPGPIQDQVKMGALLSILAAPIAIAQYKLQRR